MMRAVLSETPILSAQVSSCVGWSSKSPDVAGGGRSGSVDCRGCAIASAQLSLRITQGHDTPVRNTSLAACDVEVRCGWLTWLGWRSCICMYVSARRLR